MNKKTEYEFWKEVSSKEFPEIEINELGFPYAVMDKKITIDCDSFYIPVWEMPSTKKYIEDLRYEKLVEIKLFYKKANFTKIISNVKVKYVPTGIAGDIAKIIITEKK